MMFRTKIGCVFAASSYDSGLTWSAPAPLNVPNPNTRFDAIALTQGCRWEQAPDRR